MKKMLCLLLMAMCLSSVEVTGASVVKERYEYYGYQKGNISPEELPSAVRKYIRKNYPDSTVLVSKRKKNGTYFVKIRFAGNYNRPYYRSLVFSHDGKVIKG